MDVLEIRKENRDLQRLDACRTPLRDTYIVVHARSAFKGTALNTDDFRQSATHNTAQSTFGAFQSYIQDVVRVLVLVIGSVTSRLLKEECGKQRVIPTHERYLWQTHCRRRHCVVVSRGSESVDTDSDGTWRMVERQCDPILGKDRQERGRECT